jgi:diguanylate cyclase (GGDEF)-like protein
MSLARIVHWEPGPRERPALVASSLLVIVLIGFAHYLSGPRFEFYIFFLLPVLVVSWYAGPTAGFLTALFALADWVLMDWLMADGKLDTVAVVFNDLARLSVFLVVSGLAAGLRAVLRREAASARVDSLTQLANRRLFYEEGRLEIGRARRSREPLTAVFIDLDGFKDVNDRLGHQAGDELLRAVAKTLREHTRSSDVVGRLGGDEFGILLPGMAGEAAIASVSTLRQRLLECMEAHRWPVTFSIGVATFDVPPDDIDALLARADALMYAVKHGGKNTIRHERFAA